MTLIHGDCIDVMAAMEPESVDAIVTDPPYGLEFMGKEWDSLRPAGRHRGGKAPGRSTRDDTKKAPIAYGSAPARSTLVCDGCGKRDKFAKAHGCDAGWSRLALLADHAGYARSMQAWHQQWAEAAHRVAKPSSYLLAFGGTRTVHRMTCALEDAGWIIRDMLVWAYASGFPKSKASLKPAWEPIVMARKPGPLRMLAIDECRIPTEGEVIPRVTGGGILGGSVEGGYDRPWKHDAEALAARQVRADAAIEAANTLGRWPANVILTDPIFDGGIEGVVGGGETTSGSRSGVYGGGGYSGGWPDVSADIAGDTGTYSRFFLIPKSSRSDREPVLDEYAYQLHKERGECVVTRPRRDIVADSTRDGSDSSTSSSGNLPTDPSRLDTKSTTGTATSRTTGSKTSPSLIPSHTSDSIPVANSVSVDGGSPAASAESSSLWEPPTGISVPRAGRSTDDADPATSRSWSSQNACARCGRTLPRVATHPTQKPTELMRHLVRLVTPTGGIVLDPFLGSGTTALAAEMEGFEWIGIEREAEYVAIAEARLNGTQRGLGLPA